MGPDTDKITYIHIFANMLGKMHNAQYILIAFKETHQSIRLTRNITCMPSWSLIFEKTTTKEIQ